MYSTSDKTYLSKVIERIVTETQTHTLCLRRYNETDYSTNTYSHFLIKGTGLWNTRTS